MSADSATQAGCENIVRCFLELHEGQRLRNRQHLGSDQAIRGVLAALQAYELITIEDHA